STPWLLAVSKPGGLNVEHLPRYPSVQDWAVEYTRRPGATKEPYIGIIHRLDRPTSGLVLLAKRKTALVDLQGQFSRREVRKTYLALTRTPLPDAKGRLQHYLLKDNLNHRTHVATRPGGGAREAVLDYEALPPPSGNSSLYAYLIRPHTGRYHQIRAQLAALGSPIAGDATYHDPLPWDADSGIALHAYSLAFTDPQSGKRQLLTAPPPPHWPKLELEKI
ncbi:MAG: RluA family pseudouridine synthase, partial [Saprospiraceae bacterium]